MRRWLTLFIFMLLLSILGWWVYDSPAFRVADFTMTGLSEVGRNDVLNQLGQVEGKHFAEVMLSQPVERLLQHPRIKDAQVSVQFPSRLYISIQERQSIALLPYHNNYLSVDEEGRILQLLTTPVNNLPLITGLQLPLLTVGEAIPSTPNSMAAMKVLQQMSPEDRQRVDYIDVSNAVRVMIKMSGYSNLIDVGEGAYLNGSLDYLFKILKYLQERDMTEGNILIGEKTISYCAP